MGMNDYMDDEETMSPYEHLGLAFRGVFSLPDRFERMEREMQLLAQDQYAKAHLGEVMRLQDRITSALMEFDEIISGLKLRIKKLEEKNNGSSKI